MTNTGKARKAAFRMIFWTLVLLLAMIAAGFIAVVVGSIIAGITSALIGVWVLFALLTLFFFRDPDPATPSMPNAIVSPAHGTVDVIDETDEPNVMGGRCRRISIFLSILDVHVQKAPVSGRIIHLKHTLGKFLSAAKADCGQHNENVLIGIECSDYPDQRFAVKLVAGMITRRIVPWMELGQPVKRSDRIGMIQYGSRCDLYMPLAVKIHSKLGDKVRGGESIVASFE
ncbi:MAG: putative phosphatidylserine decarboxylase [Verrucomicrobiales bacterium]|nr:putative phosphatidylserine decarboxylase [Verrucomicrobiales bacterium]